MQARNSARIRLPALPEDGRDQDACEGIQIVRPPQLTRGNMYRMVIPAPFARSRTIVSPSLNSACMASQQEFDHEAPRGMARHSSPELTRASICPSVAARPNWARSSCRKWSVETMAASDPTKRLIPANSESKRPPQLAASPFGGASLRRSISSAINRSG
jgi:hypothetical protein